jgi:1-acyl-sn-glycerol-3-phosphate acyltransferase
VNVAGAILTVLCVFFMLFRAEILLRTRLLLVRRPGVLVWVTDRQVLISRKIFILCRMLTGFRLSFEALPGVPLPRTFLLVSNHQSLLDIPVLMASFPRHGLRFVTKKELGRGLPYISLALRLGGHALISRTGDFGKGRREMKKLASRTAEGVCPVVFPEGTRSRDGGMHPFLSGAFRIILDTAPLPVLSVAIDGGWRMAKLLRIFGVLGSSHYRVKPLTLYPPPRGKREILDVLARAEGEIGAQLAEWHAGDCLK